jgi:hypothetical protein
MATEAPLPSEDLELLDRVAGRVADLRLETAAILTIESTLPLSVVAGQAMLFFEPLVAAFLRLPDYRRFARLVENRDALELLVQRIEDHTDEREKRKRAEKAKA